VGKEGIYYSSDPGESDILLINTCGFIESAKKESIEEILKLSKLKGKHKKLVVFGCLAKRYGDDLKREIPEIDVLWGVGDEDKIVDYCSEIITKSSVNEISKTFRHTIRLPEDCRRLTRNVPIV
jgi:ribosomal protein S12 methylthiotransferase